MKRVPPQVLGARRARREYTELVSGRSERGLVKCAVHDLHFDRALHSGCVICRREDPRASQPASASRARGNDAAQHFGDRRASAGDAVSPNSLPPLIGHSLPQVVGYAQHYSAPPGAATVAQFQPAPAGSSYGPNTQVCGVCGAAGADYLSETSAPRHRQCAGLAPDQLHWLWIALVYLLIATSGWTLVPLVPAFVLYFLWRREYPNRARSYVLHVWVAFAASCMMLFLSFLVCLINAASGASPGASAAAVSAVSVPKVTRVPAGLTTYTSDDGIATVRLRGIWKPTAQTLAGALKLVSPDGSVLLIVNEPVLDFEGSVGNSEYLEIAKRVHLKACQLYGTCAFGPAENVVVAGLPGVRAPL